MTFYDITEVGPKDSVIFHFPYLSEDEGRSMAEKMKSKRVALLSSDEVHIIIIRGEK